jgi:type I restriction enzyme, S subunit
MNVKGGLLNFETDRYTSQEEFDAFNRRLPLATGDVLLTIVGTIGRSAVVDDVSPLVFQRSVAVIRPRVDRLSSRYLYHVTQSAGFQTQLDRAANKSSQAGVYLGKLGDVKIPLPPLPEQRRIAAILDQADALRAKRREALAQLDSLTQSIFSEMFGESLLSLKRTPLGDLVEEFRYDTSEKSGDGGFPALRIPNVANGHLNLSELKTVPVEAAEFRRLQLKSGDLLFVRTNGNPDNVGRCAVFEPSLVEESGFNAAEFIYASYLIRARLKARTVSPVVLQQYLHVGEGRYALRAVCKTSAGQYNINTEGLGAIPIPSFPSALQQTFATRIQAVEALKATHRAALAELDALFASLQHRAFSGGL